MSKEHETADLIDLDANTRERPSAQQDLTSHLSSMSVASSTESSTAESGISAPPVMVSAVIADTSTVSSKPVQQMSVQAGGELEVAAAPGAQPELLVDLRSENVPKRMAASAAVPTSVRPGGNTGAIPKSISFDKAVFQQEPPTSEDSSSSKHKSRDKSFLKGFKFPKIGRNRGGGTNGTGGSKVGKTESKITESEDDFSKRYEELDATESSDDILAKYRKKPAENGLSTSNEVILHHREFEANDQPLVDLTDGGLSSSERIEDCFAFQDAKRKLRLMLAEADLSLLASLPPLHNYEQQENELVWVLRVQLAEALNLQDRNLVAKLYETLRCLSLFDSEGCRKLVRSLRDDYRKRSPYLSYLIRCRQGLLATLAHQERLLSRFKVDKTVCSSYLVSVVVRLFLEKRDKQMSQFVAQFKQAVAADEKTALMEGFLERLWSQLESDSSMICTLLDSQIDLCRLTVERSVVGQIYVHAMYPNGEADISRDEVLSSHIKKLSSEITPNHRDLKIPTHFQYEQPWPSAQAEIRRLAAYKTPQDKVACVARCSQTIMNLLSLSSKNAVPAADDFVPVMVFVIIKANPPSLLSTIQYVDSFFGNRMVGEDQYWWMQFVAAIEFIKTMDYDLR